MKKKVLSLLMACVLVFGTSTTVLAAGSPVVDNAAVTDVQKEVAKAELNNVAKIEINSEETAVAAKTVIKNIDKKALSAVMTEDATVRNQVADIEADYTTAMNIDTEAVVLSDVVTTLNVVGAGLNADEVGSKVDFVVAPAVEEVFIPENYKNIVKLDLGLQVNGTAKSELDVPVAITMNVPAGLNTENLVILHFHNSTTASDRIVPTLNADGTITFSVDKFSTFAFANEVVEVEEEPETFPAWGQGWPWNELEAQAAAQNAAANTTVTSPKTGDVNFAAVGAVVAMAGVAVVVLRRKEA